MLVFKKESECCINSLTIIKLVLIIAIIGFLNSGEPIFGSPIFPSRVIFDDENIGMNVVNDKMTNLRDKSADISAVTYFSTGKTLNTTFWLHGPFTYEDAKSNSNIYKKSYGMFIDTDFDKVPNYRIEIQKFQGQNWIKTAREFEPHYRADLEKSHRYFDVHPNYSDFHAYRERYVDLTFDLGSIGYPDKYQVLFYTGQRGCLSNPCDTVIYDFTEWVLLPPPKISLSLSPNPLPIRPGEVKPVDVEVNSTWDFTLSAKNKTNVVVYLETNRSYSPSEIARIMIKIPDSGTSLPSSILPIGANAIVPSDSMFKITTNAEPELELKNRPTEIITQETGLKVNILEPYTFLDYISNFNNTMIIPISGIWTFLLGVLAMSIPWVLRTYRQRQKDKYQKKLPE